jgi:hypothetical protein
MPSSEQVARSPAERTGVERSLEVGLGSVGGFELRSTRLFVWRGSRGEADERIVSFGGAPVGLDLVRPEKSVRAGPLSIRTLGNPLMTVALAGAIAVRRWANPPEGER